MKESEFLAQLRLVAWLAEAMCSKAMLLASSRNDCAVLIVEVTDRWPASFRSVVYDILGE